MSSRNITADRGDAGTRLDRVVCRHLADLDVATRSRVQRWIVDGKVTVNGLAVRRAAARVAARDRIAVALPSQEQRRVPAAEELPLEVLYEDEWVLAVNKPAGIVVHPAYKHSAGTLLNALLWHARGWPAGGQPSLVGRLDKLTSGIVIVAKTKAVHAAMQRAMASGDKDYLAVVYGRVNITRADIDLRLGRDPCDRRRVIPSATVGRPSVTRVERLARVDAPPVGLALLRCRLETGRTHQIRVHLAARGWPIVGDATYGEPRWREIADAALARALRAFERQALHAWRIAFLHPVTGQRVVIDAPPPADFTQLQSTSGLA